MFVLTEKRLVFPEMYKTYRVFLIFDLLTFYWKMRAKTG